MSKTREWADTMMRFLAEPAVGETLASLRQDAYRDFLLATDDDSRRNAHAFGKALDRLDTALQSVVDAGERERTEEESADRRLSAR